MKKKKQERSFKRYGKGGRRYLKKYEGTNPRSGGQTIPRNLDDFYFFAISSLLQTNKLYTAELASTIKLYLQNVVNSRKLYKTIFSVFT